MNKDELYIFAKRNGIRSLLGEVQSGFNMSLVIDGTKDSFAIIVWSYSDIEIEPYTICWHKATDTYWTVSHDKVERRANDSGFIYIHNLELNGAIEVLNARDLTDCAFNDKTYTFQEFIGRLFRLSNWELGLNAIEGNVDLTTKVNFIKTFENYTLLSALREFLDAYNYSAKLYFTQDFLFRLQYARLKIVPKTGDRTLTTHTMDYFDDVRETKTMDKNSFGTCVVSNAENVISKIAKTYPSTGGVKCSAHEYIIKAENAVIRLPSKVYKANWLKVVKNIAPVSVSGKINIINENNISFTFHINPLEESSINIEIRRFLAYMKALSITSGDDDGTHFYNAFEENFNAHKEKFIEDLVKASTITLYDGVDINAYTGEILKGNTMPYLAKVDYQSKITIGNQHSNEPLIFCDKDTRENLKNTYQGIYWERGSDEIKGFDGFEPTSGNSANIKAHDFNSTDLRYNGSSYTYYYYYVDATNYVSIETPNNGLVIHFRDNAQWIVNYYPMSDIKIKVDNQSERHDIQLYNQNGKLTDNYALSKMLNSYAKQISGDTITRYMYYTDFNDIPKLGSLVYKDNDIYVINNISMTFTQNENTQYDFGYYIECEFTMSKNISVKSLMVNPNTNIRDYGIPQNYNVKRKQVYRDYYELAYSRQLFTDNSYYLEAENVFTFGHYPNIDFNLVAVMKIDYDEPVNSNYTYYYQLETTVYDLNKMFYIMLDFKDNNIIGYGSQNVWSGFVLSRVFGSLIDTLNTPLSYVDSKGRFDNIEILLMDNEDLTYAYAKYLTSNGYEPYEKIIYNLSPFIPQDIFDNCYLYEKIRIYEINYDKDALEVPVFEYGCQAADTGDVLIGDDIFRQHDNNFIYFYSFVVGDNLTVESATTSDTVESLTNPLRFRMLHSASITFDSNILKVRLYSATTYNIETGVWEDFTQNTFALKTDYAIFRHAYNLMTGEEIVELLFIAKNISKNSIDNNDDLIIYLNHYQLN